MHVFSLVFNEGKIIYKSSTGAKKMRSEQQQDVAGQNCCPTNTSEIKRYAKAPYEIIWNKPPFLNHFYASSLLPLQEAVTIHKNKFLCLHEHISFKRQIEDKPLIKETKKALNINATYLNMSRWQNCNRIKAEQICPITLAIMKLRPSFY